MRYISAPCFCISPKEFYVLRPHSLQDEWNENTAAILPPHTYSCSQSPQVRYMTGRLSTSNKKMAGESASAGDLVGKVLQGTCGWSDSSIVKCGRFYPGSVKTTEDRLLHYSRVFPCVECDTSNYAIPSPTVVEKWLKCVPAGFKFHFKAFGFFTRKVRLNQQQLLWNKM